MGGLRSDRVMYFPAPRREPGTNGRPLRHGAAFRLAGKQTWPAPAVTTVTGTARYGTAGRGLGGLHQRLAAGAGGRTMTASCRLSRAPSSGWPSITCPAAAVPSRCGCGPPPRPPPARGGPHLAGVPAPLRYRTHVQVLQAGPGLDPAETAGPGRRRPVDLADHRRLYPALARPRTRRRPAAALAAALPARPADPSRVRRGFRNIRQTLPGLASAPKPGKPGPGRPPGSKNRRQATRHDVGKTAKRDQPTKESRRQKG